MWTTTNHPGGFGRRWQHQDGDLLGIPCWHYSPTRAPVGHGGTSTWRNVQSGAIAGSVHWMVKGAAGARRIVFLFSFEGRQREEVVEMQADEIADSERRRWWWTCPQCERRCGKVYIIPPTGRILCRACGSVTYTSRQHRHPRRFWGRWGVRVPPGLRWADIRQTRKFRNYRREDRQRAELARLGAVIVFWHG